MDEQKILEVTVHNNRESYRDYYRFAMMKLKGVLPRRITGLCVIVILGLAEGILGLLQNDPLHMSYAVFLLFIAILCVAIVWIRYMFGADKKYGKIEKTFAAAQTYCFFKDYVQITSQGEFSSGISHFNYVCFSSVYESSKAFYLMTAGRQGCLIPKKEMAKEQTDEIRNYLIHQFGDRFLLR